MLTIFKPSKLIIVGATALFLSCGAINKLNLFPVSKDVELGLASKQQLEADPNIKVVPREKAPEAYRMLDDIVAEIKASGKLTYKDQFPWEVSIIKDDKVLNAFCTPGGHIYFYTGLMKYLDSVDDLAGVMGHEMAHADRRHSTNQLTKQYGTQTLLQLVLNQKNEQWGSYISNLLSLQYSRSDETEADSKSVEYLCGTKYQADGAAQFFKKIVADEGDKSALQTLFSTHPNPGNRVANITEQAQKCPQKPPVSMNYKKIVSTL